VPAVNHASPAGVWDATFIKKTKPWAKWGGDEVRSQLRGLSAHLRPPSTVLYQSWSNGPALYRALRHEGYGIYGYKSTVMAAVMYVTIQQRRLLQSMQHEAQQ
jgi:hypothetical protein